MIRKYVQLYCQELLLLALLPLLFLFCNSAQADDYYSDHAMGWHWYNDLKSFEAPTVQQADPVQQMNAMKKAVTRALDNAVLHPTPQNIENYIQLQNQISNNASHFAQVWQWVLLHHPQMDYSIEHPTNQVGREIYLDQQTAKEDAAIKELVSHTGLFFFYRSSCPYCVRFAPIVKHFSERYHIAIVPITTDGIAVPEFPNSRVDQGQSSHFRVTVEPALFTVNPQTGKAIPVSYGLISESDLRQRILNIATHFQEDN